MSESHFNCENLDSNVVRKSNSFTDLTADGISRKSVLHCSWWGQITRISVANLGLLDTSKDSE